jgi:lambda repressor-like predicted transcriptional regulator
MWTLTSAVREMKKCNEKLIAHFIEVKKDEMNRYIARMEKDKYDINN